MAEQTEILNYRILLKQEPEGGYTVTVPALPGCNTFGSDMPEALALAKEAIELYLESLTVHGEPIPNDVTMVKAEDNHLLLVVAGQAYRIAWTDCSSRLAQANKAERALIEVSPSGYGLHWPLIDEDLAITPLLEIAEPVLLGIVN